MTLSSIKTFILICLVTLLIWLLAESESLRVEKVQVRVLFYAGPDSGRLVRVEPGQDFSGTVTLRLEGSTARVDALVNDLKKEVRLEPGTEGVPAEPGKHTVELQSALRSLKRIRDSGVSVADADPPTATILVDNLVDREARVHVEIPEGQSLEAAPESNPVTVHIRLPEAAAASLPPDLEVTARVSPSSLVNLPEARRATLSVPIEPPESIRGVEGVKISPSSATVAITLRSRTAALTLPGVPVHVRLPATELGLWDIQMPESSRQLTDVAVTGPSDLIAQIRAGTLKPIAYVALSFEELEKAAASGQPLEKEATFSDLPTALKFEVKQKSVRLMVKRREQAAPGKAGT